MDPQIRVKENWFTRPPSPAAVSVTFAGALVLISLALGFLGNSWNSQQWMAATPDQVFRRHEYWRLWSTLFAHGDVSHLLNNLLLFLPLAYLLSAYFRGWLFPAGAFVSGGVVNFVVLKTLPMSTTLLGVSGVVYWMGAVWLTLFVLIDSRKNLKFRFANVLFLSLMIFIPETYKPQVSYLSHFLGFALGVGTAFFYYRINRRRFREAEVLEYIFDDEELEPSDPETGVELSTGR